MAENMNMKELSRAQLASALADSYREIESLRSSVRDAERRAEHAESMLSSFQVTGDSERAVQEIRNWEKRARDAELVRDEEVRRKNSIRSVWHRVKDYLRAIDDCTTDARLYFDRIVADGGLGAGVDFTLKSPPPKLSRPRTESLDNALGLPPAKRPRFPVSSHHHGGGSGGHSSGRRRSSSHSSNDSLDVDEMLLQATGNNGRQQQNSFYDHHQSPAVAQPPPHVMMPSRYPVKSNATYPMINTGPPQVQSYQTHIFAPPVTGAPVKKAKLQEDSAMPTSSYPATNAEGQRICRQCGMPGRYKDGKCVEKWGPGPMGPGTVCDRCRKKMKRVERRGTLDSIRPPSSATSPATHHPHPQPPMPVTMPAPIRTLVAPSGVHRPPPPTPTVHVLPSPAPEESAIRTGLYNPLPAAPPNSASTGGHSSKSDQDGDPNQNITTSPRELEETTPTPQKEVASASESSPAEESMTPIQDVKMTSPDIELLEAVTAAETNNSTTPAPTPVVAAAS